uniref:Calcium/calmodulin dependent protein kinase IV n=1 Tax=Canis lupus familiaris TaxID=9615 RepID=A0A8P0PQU5_CANLF
MLTGNGIRLLADTCPLGPCLLSPRVPGRPGCQDRSRVWSPAVLTGSACLRPSPPGRKAGPSQHTWLHLMTDVPLGTVQAASCTALHLQHRHTSFPHENRPPEILRGCAYGPEVDMWSVGIITYILLCGFEPFYDERGDQFMFRRILNCEYYFISPWWDEVSLNAKDLVRKLIVLDPKKRLTTFQALQHPWVTGKAANFVHMDTAQKKLQEFNARRKLKAAVKAVVASSRLGSASSSHGSIQESQKASQEPSPTQDGSENVKAISEGEKVQGGGAHVAVEGAEAELMKVQAAGDVEDADGNAAKATNMVPKALEDEMKVADAEIEEGLVEEKLKSVEGAAAPKEGQENPALGFGAPQNDVILPEY